MKSQKKAYFFAFSAIAFWSTIGSAFKISLAHSTPGQLLMVSTLVACIVLFSQLIILGKFQHLRNLKPGEILFSAFLGLLNPFLYYTVLLKAYDLLQAQEAGTLNYIWPLVLVLLSIPMLHQKISLKSIIAILISFTGIVIISSRGHFSLNSLFELSASNDHTLGIFLAVASAIFWALYWIYNVKDQREDISKLFLNFCFGCLYSIIYMVLSNTPLLPDWQGLAGGVYIGFFEMGITFVLWLSALKYSITTAKVSNLIYLSPFISLILIHFTVGETILPSTITGLIFIVTGIIMQQYLRK